MSKKTILTIEDDSILLNLEKTKLEEAGFSVLTATNSVEAYQILENEREEIALLVIDLLLPNVDGFAILERIRDESMLKNVPIVVFSNLYDKEDIKRAKELGVNDFMIKANYTLSDLIKRIRELVN